FRFSVINRFATATLNCDNSSAFHKQIGDRDGAVEQTAWSVSQIENERFHPACFEVVKGGLHFLRALLADDSQADVANLSLLIQHEVPGVVRFPMVSQNTRQSDGISDQSHFVQVFRITPLNPHRHWRADRSAEELHRSRKLIGWQLGSVYRDDAVSRP